VGPRQGPVPLVEPLRTTHHETPGPVAGGSSFPSGPPVPPAAPAFDVDRAARHNFRLSVWNGILFNVGETFIETATILALFVSGLTDRSGVIGLAVAIQEAGWYLPQILTIAFVESRRRRLPLYTAMAYVRITGLVVTTLAVVFLGDRHPGLTLGIFFAAYSTYAFAGGFAAVSFYDVVGRTIPLGWHPRMWAYRLFFGGLLAAACGFLIQRILTLPDYSLRYGILFGIATVLIGSGAIAFTASHEPPVEISRRALHMGVHLRENLKVAWRDPSFRALFGTRVALAGAFTAAPFLVLYALGPLGLAPTIAGGFVTARIAGFVASNLVWQRIATHRGHRSLMRGVALAAMVAPVLALLTPLVPAASRPMMLFVAFAGVGAAVSGTNIGYQSLLLAIAPAARRPSYVGLMNSFLGPFMLLPALAGLLVDWTGPLVVFAVALVAAGAAFILTAKLPQRLSEGSAQPPGPEGEPTTAA